MKNLSKKVEFARLNFAVLAMAFVCIGLLGCSDKEEFWWDDDRSNAKVVGFVDDSLVIVGDFRFWNESTERWNGEYLDGRGAGNPRLCLYNYRVQEGGPRWCDSLSEEKSSGWFGGQMTDSIVWGGVLGEYIKLWKIGDEPHEMKLSKSFEGCSQKVSVQRIHQWLDGKFIALGSYSMNSRTFDNALTSLDSGASYCQYAVLDTVTRTITYKRLDEKLKWIGKCDDVRAWGEDVYCLKLDKETYDAELFINDNLKFIMERNQYKLGNYANVSFMGPYLKLHQTVYKYHEKEIERMSSFSSQEISFGDGKGNNIIY